MSLRTRNSISLPSLREFPALLYTQIHGSAISAAKKLPVSANGKSKCQAFAHSDAENTFARRIFTLPEGPEAQVGAISPTVCTTDLV